VGKMLSFLTYSRRYKYLPLDFKQLTKKYLSVLHHSTEVQLCSVQNVITGGFFPT